MTNWTTEQLKNLKEVTNHKVEYSYTEWANLGLDWSNRYTVKYSVESYLFRYNNYQKGLKNKHIMKSTFGVMSPKSINKDIKMWYNRCIGAYNEVKYTHNR